MKAKSLCLIAPALWGFAAFGQTTITALVCDQIQMPAKKLERAEKEADRILGSAGISVRWSNCNSPGAATLQELPNIFVIRVRNLAPVDAADSRRRKPMGRAFLLGNRADVYYDAVRELAHDVASDCEISTIFAYVIAHELGHLLLGPQHSPQGVMEASWGRREVEMMTRHELRFSQAERERVQSTLVARAGASGTSEVVRYSFSQLSALRRYELAQHQNGREP